MADLLLESLTLHRPVSPGLEANEKLARRLAGQKAGESAEAGSSDRQETQQAFHQLLGETLFRMAVKEMRKTAGSSGLFGSGATSEIVFGMFDEHVATVMAAGQPPAFSQRYFEQFNRMRFGGTGDGDQRQLDVKDKR